MCQPSRRHTLTSSGGITDRLLRGIHRRVHIGDGELHYAPEKILELYYNWEVKKGINVSADLPGVNHPAYNQDRGAVAIVALRVHFAY